MSNFIHFFKEIIHFNKSSKTIPHLLKKIVFIDPLYQFFYPYLPVKNFTLIC